jgi:dTDP-glucose pyrophosphorylase
MKVVILCGGKGTRLREETEYRPKPMLQYRVDTLRRFTRKATA